jgi:hypothetical protein
MRTRAVAAVVVATALALTGCGGSSGGGGPQQAVKNTVLALYQAMNHVSPTAECAVYSRAAQAIIVSDGQGASQGTAKTCVQSLTVLDRIDVAPNAFGVPKITDVRINGVRASARILVTMPKQHTYIRAPVSLVRQGGVWRLTKPPEGRLYFDHIG